MYGHPCEHCDGTVREKLLSSEVLRVGKEGYVILERVPVGVCDRCGLRYYHSSVLKAAEEVLRSGGSSTRSVPVAPYLRA